MTLDIRHVASSVAPAFIVTPGADQAQSAPITIPSPAKFRLGRQPNSTLIPELAWYLEHFLEYPLDPETDHAKRVLEGLKEWGSATFKALFVRQEFGSWPSDLESIQIRSNDPEILSWPWEALFHPECGAIGLVYKVSRALDVVTPQASQKPFGKERLNILVIIARPFERDVHYRSIARPLMTLIRSEAVPVNVDILRPPTFEQLSKHLSERPSYYHVLHFDGHGGYGSIRGGEVEIISGHLMFENELGEEELKTAFELSALLRECPVPLVVLNACQSAAIDRHAQDAFASVATALISSGVGSVVAMSHSLYVSAAEVFIPAFYTALFKNGTVADAVLNGRQEMYRNKERLCGWGRHPLDDWLVPELYQMAPTTFAFVSSASVPERKSRLPLEAQRHDSPFGLVGRDRFVHRLERWLQHQTTAVVIHGLTGSGKTILDSEFLHWLEETGGLGEAFWVDFNATTTATDVTDRLNEVLQRAESSLTRSTSFLPSEIPVKRATLIVFDGLGLADANLSDGDRAELMVRVKALLGSQVKLMITSCANITSELFLCLDLPIVGLDKEEQLEYCEILLRQRGLETHKQIGDLSELLNKLSGNPGAIQAVVANEQLEAFETASKAGNALDILGIDYQKLPNLFSTIEEVECNIAGELRPILELIGLYAHYLLGDRLLYMAKQLDPTIASDRIEHLLGSLEQGGMVQRRAPMYELHPLLPNYLLNRLGRLSETAKEVFVEAMERDASELPTAPVSTEQRYFDLLGANCRHALVYAAELSMEEHWWSLSQSLAFWAQNSRNFAESEQLYERMAERAQALSNLDRVASAYHNLGIVRHLQNFYHEAMLWYEKSLALRKQTDTLWKAAATYHQMGLIARTANDFERAREYHHVSLELTEGHEDENLRARAFQELGNIAFDLGELSVARDWYLKALTIHMTGNNLNGTGAIYHELSMLAFNEKDLDEALRWGIECYVIREKNGAPHDLATNCHQLGAILLERGELERARSCFLRSV